MTSSLRSTPDRAASDELLLRVHSRRPGRAHAVRHPEALHALTPTPAPATVTHTSSPTRDLGTTVLRHLNSPQVLSKDGGKLTSGGCFVTLPIEIGLSSAFETMIVWLTRSRPNKFRNSALG